MQVFVPYKEPLQVAKCLDPKRLNKQIIECQQILDAINGVGKGWFNHPITKMYRDYSDWLENYWLCLKYYRDTILYCIGGQERNQYFQIANKFSNRAIDLTPPFLTEEFCDQHKKRLYTKNPEHYKQFAEYGKSEENWYFIDGEIVKYINGKKI